MIEDESASQHTPAAAFARAASPGIPVTVAGDDDDTAQRQVPLPVEDDTARRYLAALERSVQPRFEQADERIASLERRVEALLRVLVERLDDVEREQGQHTALRLAERLQAVEQRVAEHEADTAGRTNLERRIAVLEELARGNGRLAADALEASERRIVEIERRLASLETTPR